METRRGRPLTDALLLGCGACSAGRSLREYDFTSARVALVSSVPGTKPKHKGADLDKYGHMRVRALLKEEPLSLEKGGHKVIFQFSSLAHLSADPVRSLQTPDLSLLGARNMRARWFRDTPRFRITARPCV